jgi:ribosome-associated heat shock protein Hsp15
MPASQRLDKWLWFARVVRTRTLAAGLVADGRVRLNRERVTKPSQPVRAGDVLTITVGPRVRVLEVRQAGLRRGSATEAQVLFADLSPPVARDAAERTASEQCFGAAIRDHGSGRPTKRDRRLTDRLTSDDD